MSEIKLAGIPKKQAKGLGIVIDKRRRSKSEEGQKINVDRLKEYRSRLVVFPKKQGVPKSGDAQVGSHLPLHFGALVGGKDATRMRKGENRTARGKTDIQGEDLTAHITRALPTLPVVYEAEKPRAITSEEKETQAFRTLREARAEARNEGQKKKRAAAKAAEEAAKK
jgi:large subunit ribosomal protein L13e